MVSSSATLKLLCPIMMIMVTLTIITCPQVEAAVTCSTVVANLSPCLGYLRGGGQLPPSCCAGAQTLNNAAKTTPDVQAMCKCIKSLVPSLGAKAEFVNTIPAKCNVNIPYKYSPSLDCSKVVR